MKKLSWDDIENISNDLAQKIKSTAFKPDFIIGITTGGLIPLYFLAKKLDCDSLLTVSASSYEKDVQKELDITYLPEIDLRGKNLLLVDEIADTGMSLKGVSEAITQKYIPKILKTATFAVNKEKCTFYPDYTSLEANEWVVFPWEKDDFPEYFT